MITIALRRESRSRSSHSMVGEIEMVGRLVEQKDVGRRRQHAGERSAARLAAGEMSGIFLSGEAELFEKIAGAWGSSLGPSPAST